MRLPLSKYWLKKLAFIFLAPLTGIWLLFIHMGDERKGAPQVAFVCWWMAVYWITEVIPLEATALMPMFLFPLFSVVTADQVTKINNITPCYSFSIS